MSFLEGERGEPRPRPPHPARSGLQGRPTLVHNVETLAWLPRLLESGECFEQCPRLVSLSGVEQPGVYVAERGETVADLVERAGGSLSPIDARREADSLYAIGGPTGALLPITRALLVGALPGTAAVRVTRACPLSEARDAARFAVTESCGRCSPCRVGTVVLARMLEELSEGHDRRVAIAELGRAMQAASACGLGRTAPNRALSVLQTFPDVVEAFISEDDDTKPKGPS